MLYTTKEQDDKKYRQFCKDIDKAVVKLSQQEPCENFGQKEVRKLKDKYADYMSGNWQVVGRFTTRLKQFDEWCGNYY